LRRGGEARRGDRGAVLVEFALILPVLAALLLGIFSGGLAYNRKLAVTDGVREGSRYGATLPVASAPACLASTQLECWLSQVATVTEGASEGQLGLSVTAREICVAYVYPNGTTANDKTWKLTRTFAGDSFSSGTCFADGRTDNSERRVQVTGSRDGQISWAFGSTNLTLKSQSVTKFEAST
jgi:TadE-like protein